MLLYLVSLVAGPLWHATETVVVGAHNKKIVDLRTLFDGDKQALSAVEGRGIALESAVQELEFFILSRSFLVKNPFEIKGHLKPS